MTELKSQKELLARHSNRLSQVRKEKQEKLDRVNNLDFGMYITYECILSHFKR